MKMGLMAAALVALVLMVAAVVSVAQDPQVTACRAANEAMDEANDAHQAAMRALEGRFRRGGVEAEAAELRVDQAKAELLEARQAFTSACHYGAGRAAR